MDDLVTLAGASNALAMDLLTPALRQSLNVRAEEDLTNEQFAIVAQFANLPAPPPTLPTVDQFDKIIIAVAAVLKKPNVSHNHGKLKLGVYRKALEKVSHHALQAAANKAIATREWMPTPAEFLQLAKGHEEEALRLHAKAKTMRRNRAQRLMESDIRSISNRSMEADRLQHLPERTARIAETQGYIVILMDGTRLYRSRETIQRAQEERDREMREIRAEDERLSRAQSDYSEEENDG